MLLYIELKLFLINMMATLEREGEICLTRYTHKLVEKVQMHD